MCHSTGAISSKKIKGYDSIRFTRVLLALWITYASYTMARRPFSVSRAEIQRDTGLTPAQTSLVDSVFVCTYTIGQLGYGRIKRYFGNKEILVYGVLCSALASAVLALSSSLWIFCVAWALNGFAQAAGWATCLSILNAWIFPWERGTVMGWWSTNMAAGGVLGNVFPAFLIGYGMTWRWAVGVEVFFLVAVDAVVAVLLVQHPNVVGFPSVQQIEEREVDVSSLRCTDLVRLDKDGKLATSMPMQSSFSPDCRADRQSRNAHDKDVDTLHPNLTLWQMVSLPGVGGICISYFLHKLVRYGFMFWLPYFAVQELKYTTEIAGYVSSFFDIGGVLGTIVSGYVSDWMFHGRGRTRVILLFTVGMIISTFFFGALSHLFVMNTMLCTVVVATVGFFAFAIDALMSGSFLLDYLEHIKLASQAGAISGVVGGVGSAGSIFQGVFTVLLSSSSWSTLFYSFSVATALAGLCLVRPLHRELERHRGSFSPV